MTDIRKMTAEQLLARAEQPIEFVDDLTAMLLRAARLAEETAPALSLLFSVLSEEPPEVAAAWAPALDELEGKLHPLGYGPTLAMAASRALAQWRED